MSSFTKQIGNIGVAAAIYAFSKYGINVLMPFDDNSSYDLVIYYDDKYYKIQVKTTLKNNNSEYMTFCTNITNPHQKTNRIYLKNEVDFFFLHCVENGWNGLISYNDYHNRKEITIRNNIPKNNNFNNIILAEDVCFDKQIIRYLNAQKIIPIYTKEDIELIRNKDKDICPICNTNYKTKRAEMCAACRLKTRNDKCNKITREKLKYLIYNYSFTKIGKMLGVTDNTIRKWCKKYNLPSKKTDILKYSKEEWEKV